MKTYVHQSGPNGCRKNCRCCKEEKMQSAYKEATTPTERDTYVEDVHKGRMSILKDIEALQKLDPDTLEENENYREPLCVDTHVVKNITLSTGGPADGFKLTFDIDLDSKQSPPSLALSHGVYWRADWGQYKETDLSESEAQTVYDFYLGGYAEI